MSTIIIMAVSYLRPFAYDSGTIHQKFCVSKITPVKHIVLKYFCWYLKQ